MTPPPPLPVRVRRFADWGVIAAFAVGLAVVSYGTFVRPQPPLSENRHRHPLPPLTGEKFVWQDYPKGFDLYYGDRVGYRDVLLGWHQKVNTRVFGEPVSERGWFGRDGWLFLNVSEPTDQPDLKPSLEERIADWAEVLADRHAYLKARGIGYVVLIAPDKSSVYPEYLTGKVSRHPPPEPAARLAELLAARGVPCVDPLPALRAEKRHCPHPLYFRLDSHWTFDGGRVAYHLLAGALALPTPMPEDGYEVVRQTFTPDLGRLVGLPEREWHEEGRVPIPRGRPVQRDEAAAFVSLLPEAVRNQGIKPCLYTCPTAPGPPLVVFHDSFGPQLLQYLSADCRRVAAVPSDSLELAAIDAEKPAVVVQEIVARKVYSNAAVNPPEVRGASKR